MKLMFDTTPKKMTKEIYSFCSVINSKYSPMFIPLLPSNEVRFNYCFTDVPKFVEKNGGTVIYGWLIWECPKIFLEAEFHASWQDPDGNIVDIVGKPNDSNRVLFLPDDTCVYENKLVDNRRKPLIDSEYTRFWITTQRQLFEIRQKHFENDEVNVDAAEREYNDWLDTFGFKPKISRNHPCICCSGKKYKKCCGKNV